MSGRARAWSIVLILVACNGGIVVAHNSGSLIRVWNDWMNRGRSGFMARQLATELGADSQYILFVPRNLDRFERPALLLFLNGYGENGRDGARQISNNFGEPLWEVQRDFPLICLAPQCRNQWTAGSDDVRRALKILRHVMNEYDVDPDRVYLTGVSAGGAGVWNIATAYPEMFAAIVPASDVGGVPEASAIKDFADHHLAIWDVYNDADPARRLVANHKTTRARLFAGGLSPNFTAYEQDHHDSWNAGYRNAAMFEWLSKQNRSENAKRAKGMSFREMLFNETGLSEWIPNGPGQWSVVDHILVCRGADASGASELSLDVELADFEFHFDYRSVSDAACVIALESVDSRGDVVKIRFESPAHGTGGAQHERSGEWMGVVNPVGQVEWLAVGWNDIRISLRDGELQLLLNGAELLGVRDARLTGKHRVKICIPQSEENDREWRYLRLWDPNGKKSRAPKPINSIQ